MVAVAALIVAAGSGERAGGPTPKQFRLVSGKPLLAWAADVFANHPGVDRLQFVIGRGQEALFRQCLPCALKNSQAVPSGATRQESVRNGLLALDQTAPEFVLIHDAARPLVCPALITRVIDALRANSDAAIPMLQVTDTLRRRTPAGTWAAIEREGLFRAQTPQGFRFAAIRNAHLQLADRSLTDDMAVAERAGLRVVPVQGEELNLKITVDGDFSMAEQLLAGRADLRTGAGYDVHRFAPGDHVWIGGIRIAHDRAAEGHSDADVALHALTDAVLGAIGAGDIGQHFPPSDPQWKGAASSRFLEHAVLLAKERGGTIAHCDITVICEAPKIGPHRDAIRARIAEIIGIAVERVNVKATTTEGLGFTGRKEGIAAHAVATRSE